MKGISKEAARRILANKFPPDHLDELIKNGVIKNHEGTDDVDPVTLFIFLEGLFAETVCEIQRIQEIAHKTLKMCETEYKDVWEIKSAAKNILALKMRHEYEITPETVGINDPFRSDNVPLDDPFCQGK